MNNTVEKIINLIKNNKLDFNIAVYDKINDKEIINELSINKLDFININKYYKNNKLLINGIIINNIKYILLNIVEIKTNIYFIHCKKKNEGYIIIYTNNIIIILNYNNEIIPYQYNNEIQKIINKIKKIY